MRHENRLLVNKQKGQAMDAQTTTEGTTQDQTGQDQPGSGRALVRECLIRRLEDAGLVRGKGVTPEHHARLLARLVEALAYMDRALLEVLAEACIRMAGGAAHTVWPSEATIRNLAASLQPPPIEESKLVRSWFASKGGAEALLGDYLVELYQYLTRHNHPPLVEFVCCSPHARG